MDCRQRTVMARIHRLKHVQRFLAADLAHDNPVRPHAQAVHHQLSLEDGALPLDVGRARFQPHHVILVKL